MAMAAGGGRGELVANDAGFELAFEADALWVGTRTDAASGPSGSLNSTRAAVTPLRTALEGSQSMKIAARMAFTPSVEVGIRQDGGDAEVGRGLVLADGVAGLAVDVRVRPAACSRGGRLRGKAAYPCQSATTRRRRPRSASPRACRRPGAGTR